MLLAPAAALIALSDMPGPDLMWSARPLCEATIRSDGVWEDVVETNVTLHLENLAEVLVSYTLTATALRQQAALLGGSDFFSSDISLSGVGQRNFLQLRLVINGSPYRQSSSHASPGLSLEANTNTLSGHVAVQLEEGAHDVRLQWKKIGTGVSSWGSSPRAADGFTSGRTLVVTARHRYMWHTHGDTLARVDTEGSWFDVPDTALRFTLTDDSTLRFLYSMTVRSDQVDVETGTRSWLPPIPPCVCARFFRSTISTRLMPQVLPSVPSQQAQARVQCGATATP
jgi:hypothetical protein